MMLSESKTPPVSERRATRAANDESVKRCARAGSAARNASEAATSHPRLDRALRRIAAVAALFIGAGGVRHDDAKLREKCRRPSTVRKRGQCAKHIPLLDGKPGADRVRVDAHTFEFLEQMRESFCL